MYLFIRQSESGKSPIETIMPEVVIMPLYILINDLLGTVLGMENVKRNVKMADFKPQECLRNALKHRYYHIVYATVTSFNHFPVTKIS